MTDFILAESLHRLVKQAIDSGAANSIAEAHTMFARYRLVVEVGQQAAADPVQQAMLLTTVALARRVFLGGVTVAGALDEQTVTPMASGHNLGQAVVALGGQVGPSVSDAPTIVIGPPGPRREGFCIRAIAAGWRGGITPIHSELTPQPGPANPLAGMLAAALAVNEAFMHVNGDMPAAGRRVSGLSLWQPRAEVDWLVADDDEPVLNYLPSQLWLIGLGHLGQAYLWGLGLLPYAVPGELTLVLQDIDSITPSTESTSVLTDASLVGIQKTRAMADWAERQGFRTKIQERLFDGDFKRQDCEPAVALCGLDNAIGRRALDRVGFDLIVEAGLGRGHGDFRTMRLHTLPGSRPTAEMWKSDVTEEAIIGRRAYTNLVDDGVLDRCGMTLLAGKAVGAPFVGAVASALALSEVLRMLHGGPVHQLIDVNLLSLDQRLAIRHRADFSALNPGFAIAA